MHLDLEIAARLEVGEMPDQSSPEEVKNTVRWGILDLVNGGVVESHEVPV